MSAALKGTIIHFILQNIDNKTGNENEIKRQLENGRKGHAKQRI